MLLRLFLAVTLLATHTVAFAQDIDSPTLFLRPHCENPDPTLCAFYDVRDPMTLATPLAKTGDELDMDVVLFNPKSEKLRGFRVWLSYDPTMIEGTDVEIAEEFPVIIPGQSDFAPQTGHVKLAADATAGQEPSSPFQPLARIKFTVPVSARTGQSPVTFHDLQESLEGHVVVTSVAAPTQNMIIGPLGTLLVEIESTGPSSVPATTVSSAAAVSSSSVSSAIASSSSVASAASTSRSSSSVRSSSSSISSISSTSSSSISSIASISSFSSSTAPSTSFELLQVQNIGIGTKNDILQITWDPLSHPKLQGYNVYYGTLPGRYLQRKSVSVAAVGTVIRDLPQGETYYAAVRGVDDENRETAFSDEVSVEIGNPATASAMLGSVTDLVDNGPGAEPEQETKENPLETIDRPKNVPGDTGAPSAILLLLGSSAAAGTLLALRRQLTASRRFPR